MAKVHPTEGDPAHGRTSSSPAAASRQASPVPSTQQTTRAAADLQSQGITTLGTLGNQVLELGPNDWAQSFTATAPSSANTLHVPDSGTASLGPGQTGQQVEMAALQGARSGSEGLLKAVHGSAGPSPGPVASVLSVDSKAPLLPSDPAKPSTAAKKGVRIAAEAVMATTHKHESKVTEAANVLLDKVADKGVELAKDAAKKAEKEVKQGVRFARQQVLAATRKFLNKLSLVVKVLVFLGVNAGLMIYIFILSRRQYRYMSATVVTTAAGTNYSISKSAYEQDTLPLFTDDYLIDLGVTTRKAQLVKLPGQASQSVGWDLSDILNQTRNSSTAGDVYVDPVYGRMLQDFSLCSTNCLSATGVPRDLATAMHNRDLNQHPYGTLATDWYKRRDSFIRAFDPNFEAAYLDSSKAQRRYAFDNWGQPPMGSASPASLLAASRPTRSGYLCNLGPPRRPLKVIRIKPTSCHVQIVSTSGSKWRVYWRAWGPSSSPPTIQEHVVHEAGTMCQRYEITIEVHSPSCPPPTVTGTARSCEQTCALVLMSGVNARPVPVEIQGATDPSLDPAVLYVDDQYLALDNRYDMLPSSLPASATLPSPAVPPPDLRVTGEHVNVFLSNAFIGVVDISTAFGDAKISGLRSLMTSVTSGNGDVVIEDSRDTLLSYRSGGNYLCATAPLLEKPPIDYLLCDMTGGNDTSRAAHVWYDTNGDDMITTAEFEAGLSRMQLSLGDGGLGLDSTQQAELKALLFGSVNQAAETLQCPALTLAQRLRSVLPVLATNYDLVTGRTFCQSQCLASTGTTAAACSASCMWTCGGGPVNVTEPVFGLCDYSRGCRGRCGLADSPSTRFSAASVDMTDSGATILAFDVDNNGQLTPDEARAALLQLYSNCTYLLKDPSSSAANVTYCMVTGRGQFVPGSTSSLVRVCGLTKGNAADWRVNNINLASMSVTGAALQAYGGVNPRECRPFPDYDPALNGKVYNASVTRAQCPACFLSDGTRVPPHYYNRSTWDITEYNKVIAQLKTIFSPTELKGSYFPYFNISDDAQFNIFAKALLGSTVVQDAVPVATFDYNMQSLFTLAFMGNNAALLNPACSQQMWLKVRPAYSGSDTAADNYKRQQAEQVVYSPTGAVLNAKMPGLRQSSLPANTATVPCPPDWGNGTQGSTSFSYFAWAAALKTGRGYKWGKALPPQCLDEEWPSGGEWSPTQQAYVYPNRVEYGVLAGMPILPGCVPQSCLARYSASVVQGGIHVQVLPFEFDAWNSTGQYQTMINNCNDPTGISSCFLRGYAAADSMRMLPQHQASYQQLMQDCVDKLEACSEQMQIFDLSGQGVPTHTKWFWASRRVYMEVEPAYFSLMSAGVVVPTVSKMDIRFTPGFCEPRWGAVERVDWRAYDQIGPGAGNSEDSIDLRLSRITPLFEALAVSLPSLTTATTTSAQAAQDLAQSTGIDPELALGLINYGNLPVNSAWFLKTLWRKPYKNESLYYSSDTADGIADTFVPVSTVASGSGQYVVQEQPRGQYWRHKRLCYDPSNCNAYSIIYKDNCWVERRLDPSNPSAPTLTPCVFPNGTTAFLDADAGNKSQTFNESYYFAQFPLNISGYGWYGQCDSMSPEQWLGRNQYIYTGGFGDANITTPFYSKDAWQLSADGQISIDDAAGVISTPLLMAVAFSMVIAAVCGLGVMGAIIFFGLKYLTMVGIKLEVRQRAESARQTDRVEALFLMIAKLKRDKLQAAKDKESKGLGKPKDSHGGSVAVSEAGSEGFLESALNYVAQALDNLGGDDGNRGDDDHEADEEDMLEEEEEDAKPLSDEERKEILYIMHEEDFTMKHVKKWDLREMELVWRRALKQRKKRLQQAEPSERFTLLPSNRVSEQNAEELAIKTLRSMSMTARKIFQGHGKENTQAANAESVKDQSTVVGENTPLLGKTEKKQSMLQDLWSEEYWQRKLIHANMVSKLAIANLLRLMRAMKFVLRVILHNFPDPFQVLDSAVVNKVRQNIMDSVRIFLKVKTVVDHELCDKEEIILGQIPYKTLKALRAKSSKYTEALDKAVLNVGRGEGFPASICVQSPSHRPPVQGVTRAEEAEADAEEDEGPDQGSTFWVDTEKAFPIVAMSLDGKDELYAVTWVRIFVHAIRKPEGDDALAVASPTASVTGGRLKKRSSATAPGSQSPLLGHAVAAAAADSKRERSLFQAVWSYLRRFIQWVDDTVDDDDVDMAYQVVVQEGPGWVINQEAYDAHLSAHGVKNLKADLVYKQHLIGRESAKVWSSRVLMPACPALTSEQRLLVHKTKAKDKDKDHSKKVISVSTGYSLSYWVHESTGPSNIILSSVAAEGATAEDDDALRPTIAFTTSGRAFDTVYQTWCLQNSLLPQEVLEQAQFLNDLNIGVRKRVIPRVKGIRLKAVNQLSIYEAEDKHAEDQELQELRLSMKETLRDLARQGMLSRVGTRAQSLQDLLETGTAPLTQESHTVISQEAVSQLEALPWMRQEEAPSSAPKSKPLMHSLSRIGKGVLGGGVGPSRPVSQAGMVTRDQSQAGTEAAPDASGGNKAEVTASSLRVHASDNTDQNTKMFRVLFTSTLPLATFLRETCDATANFATDYVDVSSLNNYFEMWCLHKRSKAIKGMVKDSCLEVAKDIAETHCVSGPVADVLKTIARVNAMSTCRHMAPTTSDEALAAQALKDARTAIMEVLQICGISCDQPVRPPARLMHADEDPGDDSLAPAYKGLQPQVLAGGRMVLPAAEEAQGSSRPAGSMLAEVKPEASPTYLDTSLLDSPGVLSLGTGSGMNFRDMFHQIAVDNPISLAVPASMTPAQPEPGASQGTEQYHTASGLHPTTELALVAKGIKAIEATSLTREDFDMFGLPMEDEEVHELTGVMVNLRDLDDDPEDASLLVWLGLHAMNVMVHVAFIWALALPILLVVLTFQDQYKATTAIEPILTLQIMREDPTAVSAYHMETLMRDLLLVCVAWIVFGYIQLTIYYLFPEGSSSKFRALLRTLFWLYLTLMIAVLVAYIFMVISWLILGAVVNPNRFLPYTVATITLLAHTNATWLRLKNEFGAYRAKVEAIVMEVFQKKLQEAMDTIKKATGAVAELAGKAEAEMNELAAKAQEVQAQLLSKAQEAAVSAGEITGAASPIQPRASATPAPKPAVRTAALKAKLQAASRFSMSPRPPEAPTPPAPMPPPTPPQPPGQSEMVPLLGSGPGAGNNTPGSSGRLGADARPSIATWNPMALGADSRASPFTNQHMQRMSPSGQVDAQRGSGGSRPGSSGSQRPGTAGQQRAEGVPGDTGMGAGGGGKMGVAGLPGFINPSGKIEPFQIFMLYADEERQGLTYPKFCALLNHLQIQVIGDKRRELFTKFDTSGDQVIGYREFEECYKIIQKMVVRKNLIEAGMTRPRLIALLVYAVLVLILIFIFIFVGVAAFTGAGTVGAVVNSLLAAGSGIALNLKKSDAGKEEINVKVGGEKHTGGESGTA